MPLTNSVFVFKSITTTNLFTKIKLTSIFKDAQTTRIFIIIQSGL